MAPLLKAQGRAEAADSKTVKVFSFEVPPGVEGLTLRFDYQPRRSEDRQRNAALVEAALVRHNARRKAELDAAGLQAQRERIGALALYRSLNNLMNVVLIDPSGRWRGRWDRNPASDGGDLVLTAEGCSRGFVPGALTPGSWTAAVECHGVFGDAVTYQLEVHSRGPLTDAERRALAPAAPEAPWPDRPRRSGPGWYFGELHSHSVHSDGKHELPELCRRVAAKGADFLCITDHNTTSALLERTALPLTLLAGNELTTFHGHYPVYALTEIVPWHQDGRVLPMEELAPKIRAGGGVVSVAHPFKIGDPVCTGCRMRDDLPPEAFDLMEVWYRAWDAAETDNLTAYALWNSLWAGGRRIVAVAARDWHGPGQEHDFPGEVPFTCVFAQDNTPSAILEAVRQGRAIMTGGPILDFRLRDPEGKEAMVGGELHTSQEADVVVRAERLEGPVELRVYRSGERLHTAEGFEDGEHVLPGLAAGAGWYRVEAWRDGMPRVITNHIVLARQG